MKPTFFMRISIGLTNLVTNLTDLLTTNPTTRLPKSVALKFNMLIVFGLSIAAVMAILLFANPLRTSAQNATQPAPTPVSSTASSSDNSASSGTASASAVDDLTKQAEAATNAANQAVNTVNLMLAFIQVAGILGGALLALTGGFLARAGFRTLQEYQTDLEASRQQLKTMTAELQEQSNNLREQFLKAVRASSLLQLGERQLESKSVAAALLTYQQAYTLDEKNPATNYFLGHIYTEQRQIDKGIDHLKRALANSGIYPPAEAALAYALRLQADHMTDERKRQLGYAEAERMFLKALNDDPAVRDINGESVYAVLGGLYKKQARHQDAIRAYEEAEQITPQNSYPIINLAMLNYMYGDAEKSEGYFKRSMAISKRTLDGNPFDFWARLDLATAQLVLGDLPEATRSLNIAAGQVSNTSPLETFMGDLYRLKNSQRPPEGVDELIAQTERNIEKVRVRIASI